jgi:starch-binding outer membrane protein, SusD/RagB family
MKKKFISVIAVISMLLVITSCDNIFDSLEGDLTKMTGQDMVSTEAGITRLLAQVYSYIPMTVFPNTGDFAATQNTDLFTMNAVDSHGGDKGFTNMAFYGVNGLRTFWNWAGIRAINSFINDVTTAVDKGIILESYGKELIAEARFVRAYCYFVMVRSYGGVPIITEVLDQYYDGKGNEQLYQFTPRASEKETWDFIIKELDEVVLALPDSRSAGSGEFRATKWAAYGLQSRVALYAASVSKYWTKQGVLGNSYTSVANKKTYMEASYAADYYAKCISASEAIITSGKFALYGANPASVSEAVANLGNLFTSKQNVEFIFGQTTNDGTTTSGSNWDVYNSPAQTVTGTSQSGRYSVALDLVDTYNNYDENRNAVNGIIKTRVDNKEDSYLPTPVTTFPTQHASINYIKYNNISDPFKNKDARFQAWVLYPNSTFRGQTIKIQGGIIKTNGSASVWSDDSETYNGQTYYAFGDVSGNVSGFYNYININTGNTYTTGFGLRKYLHPSAAQLYVKATYYDIRYAEILLNYCEAVVESNNSAKVALAKQYLNDIRHRAAFTDNVELSLNEVLHQRRLELAFENDYLYTLHRRRSYYNQNTDPLVEARRHALTPVVDLSELPSGGSPKYIFVRSIFYQEDAGGNAPSFHTNYLNYYLSIPDYGRNDYEPNPIDE